MKKNNIKLNEIEIDDKNLYWWKCKNNHIYKNSIEQVKEQISRSPKPLPTLKIPNIKSLDDLKKYGVNDFILDGYEHHPPIKAKMAI